MGLGLGLPSSDPNLADPLPLTRPLTPTPTPNLSGVLQMDGGPSLPFTVGDRTHRPLTRWMALDDKRVAFGAATDTQEAMRSYAAGLQVAHLLWPTYYGHQLTYHGLPALHYGLLTMGV